jgi:hypothetical protein
MMRFTMKHGQQNKQCERAAAAANDKLAKIGEQRGKLQGAVEAARDKANRARAEANSALALAVVGEFNEKQAADLRAEADRGESLVAALESALAGLDAEESAATDARSRARADLGAAERGALAEHADAVAAEFRSASRAYIATLMRLLAIEDLRKRLGVTTPLLRGWEPHRVALPSLHEGAPGDPALIGWDRLHWFVGTAAYDKQLPAAIEAERERLAALGIML